MAITISGTTGIAGVDGSAGTPAVQGTDTNTGVFYPAADTVGVSTGGSERMRVDSSGNVGIGTSSPAAHLEVSGTETNSGSSFKLTNTTASTGKTWHLNSNNSGKLYFSIPSVVDAVIFDSNGYVGINTTPSDYLHVFANTTTENGIRVQNGNASGQSAVQYYNNAGTQKGDVWWNNNGSTFNVRTLSTDPLIFYTNNTERMRFDGSGNLLVGTTSQYSGAKNNFYRSGAGQIISVVTSVNSGTNDMMAFLDGDSNVCGYIQANTTANTLSYVTSSDYRLKENIQPMVGGLAKVMQLKPSIWNWKSAPEVSGQGFIAHELQEVIPDAVCGEKDELDADNNPKYQGVDTSFLVATLTAAIQEQQALIQALTDRITALEAK